MLGRQQDEHVRLDHAVIGGNDLSEIDDAFDSLGMEPTYAGKLENDINHLSQLGFEDGSYFELTATLEPGQESPWWDVHMQKDAGPTAWAVEVTNIASVVDEIAERGTPVDGPNEFGRERPDGTYFEYELATLGTKEFGTQLPFLIEDHTPRSNRVSTPTPSVADTELVGVGAVVVGLGDLDDGIEVYRQAFDLPEPSRQTDEEFGAELAHFPDTPIVLATPLAAGNWLADRLETFDDGPCAYLLRSSDWDRTTERFSLTGESSWFDDRLAWIDSERLDEINVNLGVLSP
ncbi:VOC family protein [Salinirubellus sp. GCM10025818]|uniref:VOC family protein n=1 Tax=Salinirubellus TaxID=2162630 RepID=UPI0030D2F6D8